MALKENARDHLGKVTGSLMYYVAGKASEQDTNDAYLRCIGQLPPIEETYAMRAGSHMEPFMISEYERATGNMILWRQEEVPLAAHPDDVFATIDGMTRIDDSNVVTEFKFLSPHMTKDQIFYRYYDQVALQMMCTGAPRGLIIVGQGTSELVEIECLRDAPYESELLNRIRAWLICVKTFTPPCPLPMPMPPPERWRKIDLDVDTPNWRDEMLDHLRTYGATAQSATTYETAGKAARALVPDDVGLVLAGDWRIARNKRGTLAITARRG
jgi:hypothetical protein